jgi:dCTP deaminase
MILSGKKIQQEVEEGRIKISPFNPEHVGPNSYDFTLADDLPLVLGRSVHTKYEPKYYALDMVSADGGFYLSPGNLYLAKTAESMGSDNYVPMIEGRSSIGRLGIFIHVTAGFGDIGYHGQWTLEIMVVRPTVLYPGDRIGQVYFHAIDGDIELYNGRYQGGESMVSKGWKG